MRLTKIVALDFADRDLEPSDWAALAALTSSLERATRDDPTLPSRLADADALLVQLGVGVTPAMLEAAPRLRYVGVFGTSTGRIDPGASRRGIAVRNVPGFSTESVAELAIAIVLDQLRDLSGARRRGAEGDLSEPHALGRQVRGRALGVVGLGAIGRRVAAIARDGFGADVATWSRTARPELGFPHLPLDALLARSEIVCVHLALAPETAGVLDASRIAQLPDGALLVHLSPLELLDLHALGDRLRAGTLHFVTDHGDEASASSLETLRAMPGCTLLPPIGYATREARAARREAFVAALRAFVLG